MLPWQLPRVEPEPPVVEPFEGSDADSPKHDAAAGEPERAIPTAERNRDAQRWGEQEGGLLAQVCDHERDRGQDR